ncbi:MAG: ribosomal subunit interface protein [Legionellaceae bacterium]|nr:ribosomal subunit interface protein [Legionellaceae bacterium]|tara:strand:+ start:230 stop:556 length:327 start_codon:yes stop_codon:yes gene_type:complete
MNINISGQNIEVTDALRELTMTKFEKITRHFDHITNVHVIFNAKKMEHTVEATLHVPGEEIFAKATEDDMYKALDEMINKLDRQVRKYKSKVTDHHRGEASHFGEASE